MVRFLIVLILPLVLCKSVIYRGTKGWSIGKIITLKYLNLKRNSPLIQTNLRKERQYAYFHVEENIFFINFIKRTVHCKKYGPFKKKLNCHLNLSNIIQFAKDIFHLNMKLALQEGVKRRFLAMLLKVLFKNTALFYSIILYLYQCYILKPSL